MDKPKISIITPVLNGERFINFCIQNVCSQHCTVLEHLIIDGGSVDGTVEMIKDCAHRYPHLRFFIFPGMSQPEAMNKGIELSEGTILSFLNVDDYYEPGVLNRVIQIFPKLQEPAFLVGNCNIRNDKEQIVEVNEPRKLKLRDLLIGNNFNPHPVNPSAYFYHKSLHQIAGLYRTDEDYGMDLEFILKAVQFAHVKYIAETWGNFRFIQGTKTFMDGVRGQAGPREERIFKPFLQSLSLQDKMYVKIMRRLFKLKWYQEKYSSLASDIIKRPGSSIK